MIALGSACKASPAWTSRAGRPGFAETIFRKVGNPERLRGRQVAASDRYQDNCFFVSRASSWFRYSFPNAAVATGSPAKKFRKSLTISHKTK
jgi:hypothetical protein